MVNLSIIKDLCTARGITLTKLASEIGMAQSAISESIKRNTMTLANLEKVANYLDVPISSFFGEKTNPDTQTPKNNSVLIFYLKMRTQLIQRLWNCPPAYHEGMTYCITELYRIEPSKFCGSPHYVCTKGQAKIYIPYGKVDYVRVEEFDTDDNENSPAP